MKDGLRAVGGERCLTLKNKESGQNMMAVFTTPVQAVAFCERIGSGARPVAMVFDDLILRSAQCDGILLDPDAFSYRIMKQDYDSVKDLRDKPLTLVRIRPDEKKAEASKAAEDMGSLPDPDAAAIPAVDAQAKEEPVVPEKAEEDSQDKPKGFFRRLFGK